MAGTTTIPYLVVFYTNQHSISGGIYLPDERLSDFLNDRRDKNILVRDTSVARLENPDQVVEKTKVSILQKSGILLAYEPPQKAHFPPRFIKYPKIKYKVFLTMDGMEVHGEVHMPGSLDLLQILVDTGDSFLPLTHATAVFHANPNFLLRQEVVLVNIQRIRFIGEVEPKTPTEPT